MLFYLHDEPSKTSWFVKHSRDIKTLHLVQWLCNHSHKLLLAPVWKFGRCCSLERPADIEKSAEALLLSGRNRKSAMSGRCLVEALGSVCPSVSLKRKEMCSAHRCCPGFFFLFLFFLHLPAEIFVYLISNVFGLSCWERKTQFYFKPDCRENDGRKARGSPDRRLCG